LHLNAETVEAQTNEESKLFQKEIVYGIRNSYEQRGSLTQGCEVHDE